MLQTLIKFCWFALFVTRKLTTRKGHGHGTYNIMWGWFLCCEVLEIGTERENKPRADIIDSTSVTNKNILAYLLTLPVRSGALHGREQIYNQIHLVNSSSWHWSTPWLSGIRSPLTTALDTYIGATIYLPNKYSVVIDLLPSLFALPLDIVLGCKIHFVELFMSPLIRKKSME